MKVVIGSRLARARMPIDRLHPLLVQRQLALPVHVDRGQHTFTVVGQVQEGLRIGEVHECAIQHEALCDEHRQQRQGQRAQQLPA